MRDGLCLVRTSFQGYFDEDGQKTEKMDAIVFIYATSLKDGILTDTKKEAVIEEHIRYSKELIKTLISDLKE